MEFVVFHVSASDAPMADGADVRVLRGAGMGAEACAGERSKNGAGAARSHAGGCDGGADDDSVRGEARFGDTVHAVCMLCGGGVVGVLSV